MGRELLFSARRKDFRIDYFCSGGPGGQHQNKTATGVRFTHIETGISASSREHRSQAQNKKAAFRRVADKLVDHFKLEDQKSRYAAGKEVVRSYHEPNDRVTDHHTGETFSFKHTVGKGDLSELIEHRRRAKLLAS